MPVDSTSASNAPPAPAASYAELRATGVALLQRLAGATWTDYNAHDPGVTILEQLCYVLTDLTYRAGFEIRDLLAGPPGSRLPAPLFGPSEVLTTKPVTILDLRKVVLDVDAGIRNAWIEPLAVPEPPLYYDPTYTALSLAGSSEPIAYQGVYRVQVATEGNVGPNLANAIQARLNACRPLGTDFLAPEILPQQQIPVCAEIEIDDTAIPSQILLEAYQVAADYVSPRLRVYTLAEMLARGLTFDEIFDGPALHPGFIDTDELAQSTRPTELHVSNLLAHLMEIDGVRTVDGLLVGGEQWVLALSPSSTPALDVTHSTISLRRGRVQRLPDAADIQSIANELLKPDPAPAVRWAGTGGPLNMGRDRNVARYHSLQHHLPEVYGVGNVGLPQGVPPARKAQVRQLRAYLLLFDQVLANCYSQLAHARDLFTFQTGTPRTYFGQMVSDLPGLADILDPGLNAAVLQAMLETPEIAHARAQRFVQHLLARFAEEFAGYSLLQGNLDLASGPSNGTAGARGAGNSPVDPGQHLAAPKAFLREYPAVSGGRGCAFDYTRPSWGETNRTNVSGLEKRIACKLGIDHYYRRALADVKDPGPGGFHLVDHILLRPRNDDAAAGTEAGDAEWRAPAFLGQPPSRDPYSAQLTFVFPDWLPTAFPSRNFVERTVREETPAHLSVRVLWFSQPDMARFEPAFRTSLAALVATT